MTQDKKAQVKELRSVIAKLHFAVSSSGQFAEAQDGASYIKQIVAGGWRRHTDCKCRKLSRA